MSVDFEQTILGASIYYNSKFICSVSGMEDAERLKSLKSLINSMDSHMLSLEGALRELVDAVINMDMRKQKEVLHLCNKLLQL